MLAQSSAPLTPAKPEALQQTLVRVFALSLVPS